jgi:hypothetical protein
MVVSPSCVDDEDWCEGILTDGEHGTRTKGDETEVGRECEDTSGGMGGTWRFSSKSTWRERNSRFVVVSMHLYAFWVWEYPRKTQGRDLGWSLLVLYERVRG